MRRNKPIKCDPERDMKPILDQLGVTWPEFLEFARKEFKRMLREIELDTIRALVQAWITMKVANDYIATALLLHALYTFSRYGYILYRFRHSWIFPHVTRR